MSERQDGGAAFPTNEGEPGMTLRDWFAGQVLTTFSNNSPFSVSGQEHFARRAYEIADAMIAARERKGE